MATRYFDAATVSDEHGKGAEILRQQTFYSTATATTVMMVAEVDLIIRGLQVHRHGSGTSATVQFYRREQGASSRSALTASFAAGSTNAPRYTSVDVPMTASNNAVRKGNMIEVVVGGSSTALALSVLWMPNLWGQDAQSRTYELPD